MTEDAANRGRRPGWIILIPVTLIVAVTAWFIVVMAGR
jgi:hypothetical protein